MEISIEELQALTAGAKPAATTGAEHGDGSGAGDAS